MTAQRDFIADLTADAEEVDGLVAGLAEDGWRRPTPAPGWTVAHQIAHLAFIVRLAGAAAADPEADQGFRATPLLLATSAAELPREATEECFGPVTVVARYDGETELFAALETMPSSLTASVLRGAGEQNLPVELSRRLRQHAGRLIYDGYPTGVAVSWAQHHGGPWPSTNSQHTSVGTTAIRRFLRPVTWQNAPAGVLPEELTDDYVDIPRRVDGVLQMPRTSSRARAGVSPS